MMKLDFLARFFMMSNVSNHAPAFDHSPRIETEPADGVSARYFGVYNTGASFVCNACCNIVTFFFKLDVRNS